MNKEFKTLLLKIAALSLKDQNWVLSQLPPRQQEQFTRRQGVSLLSKARQFRKVPYTQLIQMPQTKQLPDFCKELKQQPPLFIAIILEQGRFEWEQPFLHNTEQRDEIKQLIDKTVRFIKPATKAYTFKQWQTQLSFIEQLENING